jgi:hypothetical protein
MNPPPFIAEAAVYRPCEAYRTVPVARHDTAASVTPATAADRIDGLEAIRDYVTRLEFAALKRKLTLPPSWPASPGPPERAHADRGEVQKMASSTNATRGQALSRGPPAASSMSSGFPDPRHRSLDRHRADLGRYLALSPGFRLNGERRTALHKAAVPRRIRHE